MIAAVVPITGLRDWIAVKKRLERVAVVRRAEMVLLSQDEVRVNLHFLGDPGQLALALEQADLRLFEESGEWLLTLLEPVPGPPPSVPTTPGRRQKGRPPPRRPHRPRPVRPNAPPLSWRGV